MQLDIPLPMMALDPREYRQTDTNGCSGQSIDAMIEFVTVALIDIELTYGAYLQIGKVGTSLPISDIAGIVLVLHDSYR